MRSDFVTRGQALAWLWLLLCCGAAWPLRAADNDVAFALPELTTAIDRDHQLVIQLSLRLTGAKAALLAEQRLPRLRHALVLDLADHDAKELSTPEGVKALTETYLHDADDILGHAGTVSGVVVQKMVMEKK